MRVFRSLFLLAPLGCLLAQRPDPAEYFEKNVRPILAKSCQACHNPRVKTAGLDLSTAEGFQAGGQSGPLISAGNPGDSRLLQVISYDERLKMPPTGKLKDDEIAVLTSWVKMGAPWPGAAAASRSRPDPPANTRQFTDQEKNFWAFRPIKDPALPSVRDTAWIQSPVDRFILARLEEKGLKPAPPADKQTLLRRATYDLTGLPPTEQEIRDFLADDSPGAFRKVVDRLLASPRYGERWGRHWLDVARYADSTGNDEDHRYPYAWRYRDYVIDAFNSDMPYDQFVREQIAGDLMPGSDPDGINRRGIIATGLLALGPKAIAQQDKKKMLYDVYDEQIDVVSKAFLGLTVACARCHDHKFDPILTRDYYSLAAIFASTRSFKDPETHVSKLLFRPLAPKEVYEKYQAHQDKMNQKKLEIEDVADQERERYVRTLIPHLADYMLAARGGASAASGLDNAVLEKWIKYLKAADPAEPHLEQWFKAKPDAVAAVAREYQKRFEQQFESWSAELAKWRERSRKMLAEMNMPPPPKPQFDPGKDLFFHEVYIRNNGPFAVPEREQEKIFSAQIRERLAALRLEQAELKKTTPPEPEMACAVEEGQAVAQQVFIRGDYNSLGERAPKAFPAILSKPGESAEGVGSGRLKLAEWLTRPDHPLTARVMANRIWQWHFVEGIVRTPDNFGKMGERPAHPELFDWLALRFIESGWSIKAMHRTMMLSSAYQMSGVISSQNNTADPENRLLSRFPRRRLAVEEIRDGLLAIDGSLDTTMGGTLQTGFGTDGENSSGRLSISPEKERRRMVYLPLRCANLPTLLNLFDFGDAVTPSGKRPNTNVAPQALFMMNSQFVADRSLTLSRMLLEAADLTPAARIERAHLRILNRRPSAEEVDLGLTYVSNFQKKFPGASAERDAWQSLCRLLIASNDFIYVD